MKNERKDTKTSENVWHCLEGLMIKYVKGDVSIRDSFKQNVNQRGLGSHRPHGTRPGLKIILSQTCDKIVCTFQIKFIFLLLYLLSFYVPSFRLSYVLASFCRSSFSYLLVFLLCTNRKVAGSIPDNVIGILHWHNPPVRTMTLWSTQSQTEMSTRRISCR